MKKWDDRVMEIVERAMVGDGLPDEDITYLYGVDHTSKEAYYVEWAAQQMSLESADGKAEVHAQIGLNSSFCPMNCKFCSFAKCNGLRTEVFDLDVDEVVEYAKAYEEAGANLILLLTTANYRFEKLVEMGAAVREVISPDLPLLSNTGDMSLKQALALKEAGFNGAYHVVRVGEGTDTAIPERRRMETIENLKRANLSISSCVEPVGPEHTPEELTYYTRLCIDMGAQSAGVGRRTAVPGTMMYDKGMITYSHTAYLVAVYRLATGMYPALNCSAHSTVVANAGGNLAWAEVGTNPRDNLSYTEKGGRGQSVITAQKVFRDTEWEVLEGPSKGWILD